MNTPARAPWEDEFRMPSIEELHSHYEPDIATLFLSIRDRLRKIEGAQEELGWNGISWRWSLSYNTKTESGKPLAYLVPYHEHPVVCVPFPSQDRDTLKRAPTKKFIIEGLSNARIVGDLLWASWSIAAKSNVDDVMDFLRRRNKLAAER